MKCEACGVVNPGGRKYCKECGRPLSVACPACGAPNGPVDKFCGECGSALRQPSGEPATGAGPAPAAPAALATERRLVSVLFTDLVGFTALSESRDPEEVREILTRYFDVCRQIIGRYGGTVEKFIGDAVMAVWGTPVTQEDDAERAVRAALELTQAVSTLGQETGAAALMARTGVLTGEAAVTIGASSQGMVAGDLVNTASRIQAVAEPGAVFVGEITRRATEAAIAYEAAGAHQLKGKAEPVSLWRALRVVAGRLGSRRSIGLEAPFVGRDREMRLLKELFHASAGEKKANLVSVIGIAGIGKSRLAWEFDKYTDGLAETIWWHRGRCLAYGEGVTYWALAEMVRMRAGIAEGEDSQSAQAKLRSTVEQHIPDLEERQWIEPRLAHLLGLEERASREREDLFSAWRLFFERMAQRNPTALVFEDMQWADAALLDFIDYLLEWSRNHPLFILTLARPELVDRRPDWGAGRRNFTSLFLEPLPHDAIQALLRGLVPGLPADLRDQILERTEGVPLYAMETVRMLLDRGLLVQEGNGYRPTGPIDALDVPETLHALIAARLDGLTPEERRIVQDASVLGKVFTKAGAAAISNLSEDELKPILSSLIRKEILSLQVDPRSPERGQYAFLQDLMRLVAYETLSRRDRKARHLSAATHLEESWTGDPGDVSEVVASHYLDAYRAVPDAEDAPEVMARARDALVRAGERAAGLAATEEAQHYFEQAARLANEELLRAELLERAGVMARIGGRAEDASTHLERSLELFESTGHTHPAARVSARLGDLMWDRGRFQESVDRMERSFKVLSGEEPDEDLGTLAAQLGRILFFSGQHVLAEERIEAALDVAEALGIPELLSQALNTKAVVLYSAKGRRREALALLRHALEVALDEDMPSAALRAYFNLSDLTAQADRFQEARGFVRDGLALARRVGNRLWEWNFLGQAYSFYALGDWDEALAMAAELPEGKVTEARTAYNTFLGTIPLIHLHRGEVAEARQCLDVFPEAATSADLQERAVHAVGAAATARAEGHVAEGLGSALIAVEAREDLGVGSEAVKEAFVEAAEGAFDLGEFDGVAELVEIIEGIPRGQVPQYLLAHVGRWRARLAHVRGEADQVEQGFKGAAGLFRELAVPFWRSVTLVEHGEWLTSQGRTEEAKPLLEEAWGTLSQLRARPWLDRLERTLPARAIDGKLIPTEGRG